MRQSSSRPANRPTAPRFALWGIHVVKGTIFFFITDVAVNQAVPGNAALQDEALKVLSRL